MDATKAEIQPIPAGDPRTPHEASMEYCPGCCGDLTYDDGLVCCFNRDCSEFDGGWPCICRGFQYGHPVKKV